MRKMGVVLFILILLLTVGFSFSGCVEKEKKEKEKEKEGGGGIAKMVDLTGKKILMIIAPDQFRDEELLKPKKIFEDAGAGVTIASKKTGRIKGMLGAEVDVTFNMANASAANYDAVIFIGGIGASVYFNDPTAHALAKDAAAQEKVKVLGAICIAPSTLANAGLLDGKRATSWESEADNLRAKGADYTGEAVTVDGKIVTGRGPDAAKEFGQKIAEMLGG